MKQSFYLTDVPIDEAWSAFATALDKVGLWRALRVEFVPLEQANGRLTAQAVWAKQSSPHYHASAMDGFAVRARDTVGASETQPIQLTLTDNKPAGERPTTAVHTGQPLPPWADAVIMIEHTQTVSLPNGDPGIEIRAACPPWQHVRPLGEDMVATELVLPANHRLRPVDLGALAGSGNDTVAVFAQPRVAIIPTGSELVPLAAAVSGQLTPGQIIEYNSLVLAAQVTEWGGMPTRWPIVPDDPEAIQTAVLQAANDHDLILLNAGSSAGTKDYTAQVVQAIGELFIHGVAVRPGHPVILGMVTRSPSPVPIIGVPGYPVSAALTGELFVEPLLAKWQDRPPYQPPTITATLTRKLNSPTGDDDFVRVAVGRVGNKTLATPISRGAGVITSLVRADGLVRIPRFSEGADVGSQVTVRLYREPAEIDQTLLMIGSHDLTIDLMAQFLAERSGMRISSANVGSLGGLVALRRGECHLAGSHLLDAETGVYNDAYIRQYIPDQPIVVVHLVRRAQGWMVPKGNPHGLTGWDDLKRPSLRFINRQRGAGTRVLLEFECRQRHISPDQINGYHREAYTHWAVAAAIASGTADFGLGVHAAAQALDLDFIPLTDEPYELVMTQTQYASEKIAPLLALLADKAFQKAVSALPGYNPAEMGTRRLIETAV